MTGGRVGQSIRPSLLRVALALGLIYASVGVGLSYWQVVQSESLTSDAGNPLVQAAGRNAIPGRILDANGTILARSVTAKDGSATRRYRDPTLAAVIGYRSQLYGTSGLERAYDAQLVGLTTASPVDMLLRKFRTSPYEPQDLVLTIDEPLQQKAAQLLGNRKGAVVAIEPSTGRILAMVSSPTFDPNAIANLSTARATMTDLQADPSTPLLNRATQGLYVPGSVFKIVTSIAGLGSGAISPTTTFPDQPGEETSGFLVDGFRVRDGHHPFTDGTALQYAEAVEVSCNIWFAHAGLDIGGPALIDWSKRLGFGAPIPFDLPTAASQVTNGTGPDGGFADRVELANAAYGQAETLVTPLQMALVAATVGNGGLLMRPQLVLETRDQDGTAHPHDPQAWNQVVDPGTASTIAAAMQQAVEGQFGQEFAGAAKVPGVPTAGKTGTAQLGGSGEPHSWFIGFAPVQSPKIAVAVILERAGSGATQAAPLGGQIMAAWLGEGK